MHVADKKRFYVGASGFSYPSWKGRFYPKELKPDEFLSYYSGHLGSVEINSTFYAFPSTATVKGWAAKTGEGFRFAIKAPKQVTHVLKLGNGSAESAEGLWKTLELLGPRRGPILFQLPPFSKGDNKLLDDFLAKTSRIGGRVFEFRHESWFQNATYKSLENSGAGLCVAETEDMKPVIRSTGSVAYFRLRLESYDTRAIDRWAEKIGEVAGSSKECYVYLRHDETGENALLAEHLLSRLAG